MVAYGMGGTERAGNAQQKKNYEYDKQLYQFYVCFAFACLFVVLKVNFMQNETGWR